MDTYKKQKSYMALEAHFGPYCAARLSSSHRSRVFDILTFTGDHLIAKVFNCEYQLDMIRELGVLESVSEGIFPQVVAMDRDRGWIAMEYGGRTLADKKVVPEEWLRVCESLLLPCWATSRTTLVPNGADEANRLMALSKRAWPLLSTRTNYTIDQLQMIAARRAAEHTDERAVLCHGDVHRWNVVQNPQSQARFIDPKGVWSEREYDIAVLLRECSTRREHAAVLRWAKSFMDVDEDAIYDWWVLEQHAAVGYWITVGRHDRVRQILQGGSCGAFSAS